MKSSRWAAVFTTFRRRPAGSARRARVVSHVASRAGIRSRNTSQARRSPPEGAGLEIVPFVPGRPLSSYTHHAITEYPTANGPADYALCRRRANSSASSRPRKSASARRTSSPRPNAIPRAWPTARFDFRGYRVPFLYSTNGEVIWFHDVRHPLNRSRRIAGFHTPGGPRGNARPRFRPGLPLV